MQDNFESGSFAGGGWATTTSGTASLSVSTLKPYSGTYSAQFNITGAGGGAMAVASYDMTSSKSSLYCRAYFYWDTGTLPLNDSNALPIIGTGGTSSSDSVHAMVMNFNGNVKFGVRANNGTWNNWASNTSAVKGQWYFVELYVTGAHGFELYINNACAVDENSVSLLNQNLRYVLAGIPFSGMNRVSYFLDDIIVSSITQTITALAGAGGSIAPSGEVLVDMWGSQSFVVTPDSGRVINSVLVDGAAVNLVPQYSYSANALVDPDDTNEKIAFVNGQRYILTTKFDTSGGTNAHSNISVYAADSNWLPTSLVSISPFQAADIYTTSCSDSVNFPDLIVFCGMVSKGYGAGNDGFVASFNVETLLWKVAFDYNADYITNIFNPVDDRILLQMGTIANTTYQGFYVTTIVNLFTPASWSFKISPHGISGEARITYFNGLVYMYQPVYGGYTWYVDSFNPANNLWSASPVLQNTTTASTGGLPVFAYLWADEYALFVVVPWQGSTVNYWRIYKSVDGANFGVFAQFAAVGNLGNSVGDGGMEQHGWIVRIGADALLFMNVQDNNPQSYMAVLDANGVVTSRSFATTYGAHETGLNVLRDGENFVVGIEYCAFTQPATYPIGIKIISPTSTFTYTFTNVIAPHTIVASFLANSTYLDVSCSSGDTFTVTVFNQQNKKLDATLTLTITGPEGYNYYDFQPVNVSASSVDEYSFCWAAPDVAGTYVIETSTVPMQLTAYDAKWLQTGESGSGSTGSSAHGFDLSQNLVIYTLAFLVLITQSSAGIYNLHLLKNKGKNLKPHIML